MAVQTRRELMNRIEELESENEDLQSRLEEIGDLASTEEEEEDEDEGEWTRARCAARPGENQHTRSPTGPSGTGLKAPSAVRPDLPSVPYAAQRAFW
jgi:hypothetical protein